MIELSKKDINEILNLFYDSTAGKIPNILDEEIEGLNSKEEKRRFYTLYYLNYFILDAIQLSELLDSNIIAPAFLNRYIDETAININSLKGKVIPLTLEELYYAFDFLSDEELRSLLSLYPETFESLYDSYKSKDFKSFTSIPYTRDINNLCIVISYKLIDHPLFFNQRSIYKEYLLKNDPDKYNTINSYKFPYRTILINKNNSRSWEDCVMDKDAYDEISTLYIETLIETYAITLSYSKRANLSVEHQQIFNNNISTPYFDIIHNYVHYWSEDEYFDKKLSIDSKFTIETLDFYISTTKGKHSETSSKEEHNESASKMCTHKKDIIEDCTKVTEKDRDITRLTKEEVFTLPDDLFKGHDNPNYIGSWIEHIKYDIKDENLPSSIAGLINLFAWYRYIDNDYITKASFAFRLTGRNKPDNFIEKIPWHDCDGGYKTLIYFLKNYSNTNGRYERFESFLSLDRDFVTRKTQKKIELQQYSSYGETCPKDDIKKHIDEHFT